MMYLLVASVITRLVGVFNNGLIRHTNRCEDSCTKNNFDSNRVVDRRYSQSERWQRPATGADVGVHLVEGQGPTLQNGPDNSFAQTIKREGDQNEPDHVDRTHRHLASPRVLSRCAIGCYMASLAHI